MRELPVDKCISIINIFYAQQNEDLWPNKIVKELEKTTGSKDKPAIINAIGLLEESLIIETDKTLTKHKQKEIKVPTDLGREIFDFMDTFERSLTSYTKLKEAIIEYNFKVGKNNDADTQYNIIKNQLRNKGWNPMDINSFQSIMRSAFKMETFYRKNILTFILNRYSEIKSKFEVNEIANKIILKLIMTKIEKIFLMVEEIYDINKKYFFNRNYCFNAKTEVEEKLPFVDLYLLLLQDIDLLYFYDLNLTNEIIANKIDDVTLSLFLLAQPSREDIQSYLTELQEILDDEISENTQSKLNKNNNNNFIDQSHPTDNLGVIKLIDIYKKYLKLKQV